nr:hypothetical protein [uncultured Actinomyces sp.]
MLNLRSMLVAVVVLLLSGIVSHYVSVYLDLRFGAKVSRGRALLLAIAFAVVIVFISSNVNSSEKSSGEGERSSGAVSEGQVLDSNVEGEAPMSVDRSSSSPVPSDTISSTRESLLDLNYVAVDSNEDIDLDEHESIKVNAEVVGRALTYKCSMYCNGISPQVRQFVLGSKYSRLQAQLYVLDSSADDHRVAFYNGDVLMGEYGVFPGEPTLVDLDVSGVSRLTVVFPSPAPLKSAVQAGADTAVGKNGGGLPGVALVEPTLIR